MAYKIVNAETLDAGLTAVADAIRDRANAHLLEAEVTEALAFPDGMAEAVSAIPDTFDLRCKDQLKHAYSDSTACPQYVCHRAYALLTANIPNASVIGNSAFKESSSLHTGSFASATEVGGDAFRGCSALKNVSLPKATTFRTYAFYQSGLEFIDLPSLSWLEGLSLAETQLKVLVLRLSNNRVGCGNSNVVYNTPIANGLGIILVPSALVTTYQSYTNWAAHSAQFRPLEEFTLDGTTTGELDWDKINAELEALSG